MPMLTPQGKRASTIVCTLAAIRSKTVLITPCCAKSTPSHVSCRTALPQVLPGRRSGGPGCRITVVGHPSSCLAHLKCMRGRSKFIANSRQNGDAPMTGGFHRSCSCVALALATGMLAGGATLMPANAADLGGNCCADLEERVAELEATTAR